MRQKSIFLVIFFLITTFFTLSELRVVGATGTTDTNCTKIEIIFARGSGQNTNEEEAQAFFKKIGDRLKDSTFLAQTKYELGTEKYGGYQYPAVAVNNWSFANAIGASLSSGTYFAYGDSVKQGVGELQSYLSQRYNKCKSTGTQYILGGYSQGAQVIGQTLSLLSREIRDKIVFVGLFGDPKLHLPEGEGWNPPACRGKDYSPWRRVAPNCDTDNGSLGSRTPYLPDDMKNKTGLWCYAQDSVCDIGALGEMSGHGEYKNDGRAIDEAALEAVSKLSKTLPTETAETIDLTVPRGQKTTGTDMVFLIDTTGSMQYTISQAVAFARNSAEKIKAQNGRVALVGYKDFGDEYTAKIFSGFDDTYETFLTQLNSLTADGGGDAPEATLHALMTAMNGLSWRNGATKAMVVLTDAGFHSIDRVDGSTLEMVAKKSLEIDPINVYPVAPENLANRYQPLASSTSGQVIINSGDAEAALSTALEKIQERPVPLLKNINYEAMPGQEVTFDASDSYVIDANITSYEWDFDGDGTYDTTTSLPLVNHTYSSAFTGTMQVRLSADNNTVANASATVTIHEQSPPVPPEAPKNLTASIINTTNNKSTVKISWSADPAVGSWQATLNEMPLGTLDKGRTSFEVTDVDRTLDVTIGIAGTGANGVGLMSTVTIKAQNSPTTPFLSTCSQSNVFLRILCQAISIVKLIIQGIVYFVTPWAI